MNTITLFLTPAFETIRNEMGYDENDDYDAYDILFQQGYSGEIMQVEHDEVVEIPEGYTATVQTDDPDEVFYLLEYPEELPEKEDFIIDSLPPGSYRFDINENVFWRVEGESDDYIY